MMKKNRSDHADCCGETKKSLRSGCHKDLLRQARPPKPRARPPKLLCGLGATLIIYVFVTVLLIIHYFPTSGGSFPDGFWPGTLTFAAAVISTFATAIEFICKVDVTVSDVMKTSAIIITLYAAGAKLLGWY
jgi:hypothetical protein